MRFIVILSLIVLSGGSTIPAQTNETNGFCCLPENIKPDTVVTYSTNKKPNVTVQAKLTEMKAHCEDGKLLDNEDKEIRFFRFSCWGYPPPDYLKIKREESARFDKLKADYTVIVLGCNPRLK